MFISEDGDAEKASSLAQACLNIINPGIAGHAVLVKLAQPSGKDTNRERDLSAAIASLGLGLNVLVTNVKVLSEDDQLSIDHPVLPIVSLATEIFSSYPQKLLLGRSWQQLDEVHGQLRKFWRVFRQTHGNHPVFSDFHSSLEWCLPIKIHMDEGTGLRKAAVLEITWGPVLASEDASWSRYFLWSSMGQEQYKSHNMGYEVGNAVLDSLTHHLALEARDLYYNGLKVGNHHFRLVCVGLEGDLLAQAKVFHLLRNWQCMPNLMCPWCLADDGL